MLLEEIKTRSPSFSSILALIRRVAQADTNVLICGETGTGKDFLAEIIHDASHRRNRIFLKIDCASIPTSLAESEFFGFEKGAFSDAHQPKLGKLQLAPAGTIYLDGVNHLSTTIQSKLLRFVQERKVEPLGASRTYDVDCRIIASISLPLRECLEQKQLRDDLYYRLASVTIELPPVRSRMEDVVVLIPFFMKELNEKYRKQSEISAPAMELLTQYSWPGNVREIKNVLEHAVIHGNSVIGPQDLILRQSISSPDYLSFAADRMMSLEELEKMYITEVLKRVRGQVGKAASILKMNRKTLLMKRKKYGIEK